MNRIMFGVFASCLCLGGCIGSATDDGLDTNAQRPKHAQVVGIDDPSSANAEESNDDYARAPVVLKVKPADDSQGPQPEPWKAQEGPQPEPWSPKISSEKP